MKHEIIRLPDVMLDEDSAKLVSSYEPGTILIPAEGTGHEYKQNVVIVFQLLGQRMGFRISSDEETDVYNAASFAWKYRPLLPGESVVLSGD